MFALVRRIFDAPPVPSEERAPRAERAGGGQKCAKQLRSPRSEWTRAPCHNSTRQSLRPDLDRRSFYRLGRELTCNSRNGSSTIDSYAPKNGPRGECVWPALILRTTPPCLPPTGGHTLSRSWQMNGTQIAIAWHTNRAHGVDATPVPQASRDGGITRQSLYKPARDPLPKLEFCRRC